MKKQCVLKNLRSEKGYKLPIDISHNLLNNIRVWCMNSKDKMVYYIAPDVIDCINRDGWPENFTVHAVYYYQGIKHDISEKDVLSTVLPDLNNIVLGMECNGYIPNDLANPSNGGAPLLLTDGTDHDSVDDGSDVLEEASEYFFYDEDPEFFEASEKYHTVEPDAVSQDIKPRKNDDVFRNQRTSSNKQPVDKDKKASSKADDTQKNNDDAIDARSSQADFSEKSSSSNNKTGGKKNRHKGLVVGGITIGIVILLSVVLLTNRKTDNIEISKEDSSQTSEINFKELLSRETTEEINDIFINDFDGNGKVEAFATTVDSDYSDYNNLWYISEQGATIVDEVGMVPQLLFTDDGIILVPWRAGYGATLCYGLYHGQVKELDFYKANIFQREENDTIYAVEEYFTADGEYHKNIACEFDPTAFELVLTEDFYESNPAEDTDFCWNRETPEVSDNQEFDTENQEEMNRIGNQDFEGSDLYQTAISSIPGTIQEWCYEDFDGDGKKEAFVSTGADDTYFIEDGEKSLWYLSDTGNVECIFDNQAYWYFSDRPFVFSDCKLFYIDARHGYYSVLGIQNDSPVEVSMPDDAYYYWISQDPESGVVTAADKREERAHVLEYDSMNMSFVDTGKTVLND